MSDLKLKLQLSVENGQFKAAITDAQGQVQKFGATATAAGDKTAAGLKQVTAAALSARRSFVENTASIRDQLQGLQTALIGGFAAKSVIEAADSFKLLQGQLRNASISSAEFTERSQQLYAVAQANGQSLSATVKLYSRVAGSIRDVTGNTRDAVTLTDLAAKAFRISGAGASEAAGATIQLSQALASGVLRGDEFNSINEQGARLIQALADGLGVSRGALRAMAEAGQLTADKVLPALLSQMEAINREAKNLPDTVGQAIQRLGNAFLVATEQAHGLQGALALIRTTAGAAAASPTAIGIGIDVAGVAAATFAFGRLAKIVIDAVKASSGARAAFAGLAAVFGGEVAVAIGALVAAGLVLVDLFGSKTPKAIEVEKTEVQKLIEKYQALKAAKEGIAPVATPANPGSLQELRLLESLRDRNQRTIDQTNQRLASPRRSDTPADTLALELLTEQARERLKVIRFGIETLNQQIAAAPYAAAVSKLDDFLKTVETKAQSAQRKLQEYRDLLKGSNRPEDPAVVAQLIDPDRAERLKRQQQENQAFVDQTRQMVFAEIADEDRLHQDQAKRTRELNITLLEAEGKDTQASLAKLADQYQGWLVTLGQSAEGLDLANKLFDASKAKIHLDAVKAEVERIVKDLQDSVEINDRRSQFAEPSERDRLQRENGTDVQQTQSKLDAIAAREGGAGAAVTEFITRAREGVRGLADDIARANEGPIAQLFRDWREGTRAMEEAAASWISSTVDGITELVTRGKVDFRSLADSIIKDIIRIQIRAAIAGLVGSIFPGFSATGRVTQSPAAAGTGGGSLTFGDGGAVKGPGSSTSDSIAAQLSNGEYVIKAASVQKFGRQFFDSLNAGFAPPSSTRRFATGGFVGSASTSGGSGGAPAPVIQIFNSTGQPVKTQNTRGPDGGQLSKIWIGDVAADIVAGGTMAHTLNAVYGLTKKPGSRRG